MRLTLLSFFMVTGCGQDSHSTPTAVLESVETPNTAQHTGQSPYSGPKKATVKWKYKYATTTGWVASPQTFPTDGDGTLYLNASGKSVALDGNGKELWSVSVGGAGAASLAKDGKTLYAAGGKKLYAFSASGELQWTYSGPTHQIYDEAVVSSQGVLYFGSWDANVYAVKTDGTLKWKYATDGAIAPLAAPSLSPDEKTVYVGTGDPNYDPGGTLYALHASDGTLKWKVKLDSFRVSGPVIGADGEIYVTAQGKMHRFTPEGVKVWQSAEGTASSLRPGLSKTGTIYSTTGPDGKLYALEASTGKTKWSFQTGLNPGSNGPPYGVLTAPVIGSDGTVYVGAMDGKMYAMNPDGSVLWSYLTGDHIDENAPSIGPDGTLFFSSHDGTVYALKG